MSDSPDSVFAIPSPSLSLSGCDLKNSKRPVSCSTNIDKVTKLKFIIAIFSLCAYSFTAGLCFHYVISTVSIVIFVVSAIIVLISVVYLASSIVSSLNGKQKIDFSEKESAQSAQRQEYTALRESTQGLEYNATPSPPPPPPPPPPLPPLLTGMNPSTLTAASNNVDNRPPCLFDQIKTGVKLKEVSDTKEAPKKSSNGSNEQGNGHEQELLKVLQRRLKVRTNTSDDESEHSGSDGQSEWIDYEGETSPIKTKVGNKIPESGYTSGDQSSDTPVAPKSFHLQSVNPVSSKTQDPSTANSVKKLADRFGGAVGSRNTE